MAARPGRGPARPNRTSARLEGDRERLGVDPARERGALHVAPMPDEDHEQMLAAYDAAMKLALEQMEQAFLDAPGDWPDRMHAALRQLLWLAAANPEQARLCTVGVFDAGQLGLERRDVWMARFMGLCQAGYSQSGIPGVPNRLIPPVAAGAIFELIRSHVTERRLDQLPDALPTATLIVLAPILGRDEALRVAEPAV
jgi:hypothetical protein